MFFWIYHNILYKIWYIKGEKFEQLLVEIDFNFLKNFKYYLKKKLYSYTVVSKDGLLEKHVGMVKLGTADCTKGNCTTLQAELLRDPPAITSRNTFDPPTLGAGVKNGEETFGWATGVGGITWICPGMGLDETDDIDTAFAWFIKTGRKLTIDGTCGCVCCWSDIFCCSSSGHGNFVPTYNNVSRLAKASTFSGLFKRVSWMEYIFVVMSFPIRQWKTFDKNSSLFSTSSNFLNSNSKIFDLSSAVIVTW